MAFEISVVSNVPLTSLDDPRKVALRFLEQIGYLSRRGGGQGAQETVPYRLFVDCLLRRRERGWTADGLAAHLGTTKATVYRHLNKLKALDLLEEVEVPTPQGGRRGYRIRYGDLAKAWNFVEAHVEVAMESYRQTVDHLQELVASGAPADRGRPAGTDL